MKANVKRWKIVLLEFEKKQMETTSICKVGMMNNVTCARVGHRFKVRHLMGCTTFEQIIGVFSLRTKVGSAMNPNKLLSSYW